MEKRNNMELLYIGGEETPPHKETERKGKEGKTHKRTEENINGDTVYADL